MYTRCPACQSAFRVTAATLRAAHGQVVCASCHTTFDALFGLMDELPPAPVAAALADANALLEELESPVAPDEVTLLHIPGSPADGVDGGGPPQVAHTLAQALAQEAAHESAPSAPAPAVELDDDDPTGTWAPPSLEADSTAVPIAEAVENAAPPANSFFTLGNVSSAAPEASAPEASAEETSAADRADPAGDPVLEAWIGKRPPRRLGWVWTLASLVLVLALGLQAAHHWRPALARHPTLGPGVTALYAALGHPLAPESDLGAFQVTQGSVGPSPDGSALRVTAVITNRSRRALALPLLQVTLEDRYGAPIGRRTFGPGEYAPAQAMQTVPARGTASATLDLADPGNEAVGFKLDVCEDATSGLTCVSDPRAAATAP